MLGVYMPGLSVLQGDLLKVLVRQRCIQEQPVPGAALRRSHRCLLSMRLATRLQVAVSDRCTACAHMLQQARGPASMCAHGSLCVAWASAVSAGLFFGATSTRVRPILLAAVGHRPECVHVQLLSCTQSRPVVGTAAGTTRLPAATGDAINMAVSACRLVAHAIGAQSAHEPLPSVDDVCLSGVSRQCSMVTPDLCIHLIHLALL
jgi:hypothetical protein